MRFKADLLELGTENLPAEVPYAVLTPLEHGDPGPLPLCLILMGGGGSRQNLVDIQPLLESMPPMVFATPSPGMDYYVEDPEAGVKWESFLTEEFVPQLRATYGTGLTAITGISVGGYGALKTAFGRPEPFAAVAAMQPMLEPGCRDAEVGARNRLHHTAGGPERLVGPGRDAELFEANQPANRARANAARIRESGLAVYIDAGDHDCLNAHDGAEHLHRVLWDLDLSHEYHLVRGGDHGGPTMRPRIRAMLTWVGAVLEELRVPREEAAPAPTAPVAPSSKEFVRVLRERMRDARESAAKTDPTTRRRFGVLPGGLGS